MIGRPLSPMSVGGMRRRSRRRGLMVGAAVGAAAARNSNNQQQQYDEQAAPAPQAEAPAAAPAQDDTYAELEKLGQLKAEGILTEEEFDAKKKQILGL